MTLFQSIRMNCRQATALAQKKEEHKLSLAERVGLWFHLSYCRLCRLFIGQTQLLNQHVPKSAEQQNHYLSASSKEQMRTTLNEHIQNNL